MTLGFIIFGVVCLGIAGAWAVFTIAQARTQHKQKMMAMVRGKSLLPRHLAKTLQKNPPLDQSQEMTADELRHAISIYQQTLDEIERDNTPIKDIGPGKQKACTLMIRYTDAHGKVTDRSIAPYKNGATNDRFDAWCNSRKARRTFIFEQVQHGISLETGEMLTRAQVFTIIHPTRKVPAELLH